MKITQEVKEMLQTIAYPKLLILQFTENTLLDNRRHKFKLKKNMSLRLYSVVVSSLSSYYAIRRLCLASNKSSYSSTVVLNL